MKRWLSKSSTKAHIGLVALTVFACVAVIAAKPNSTQTDTKLQSSSTSQNTPATVSSISEKPKIAAVKTEVVTSEEEVPFNTVQTYDGTLAKDTTVVRVEGQKGKKVVKTEVKTKDGVVTSRELISEEVTVPPVNKVVAIGTKAMGSAKREKKLDCNPNYKQCIPTSWQDIDCADLGYRVEIIGIDVLNLDEGDDDSVACEDFSE